MATATSKVNAVVAALVAGVQAAMLAFDTSGAVRVYEGVPMTDQPEDWLVIAQEVNQTYEAHAMVGSLGSGSLREEFQISVHIASYRGSDSPTTTTRARCAALAGVVDDFVRNDPQIGGTCWLAFPSAHAYRSEPAGEQNQGVETVCDMFVTCNAIP